MVKTNISKLAKAIYELDKLAMQVDEGDDVRLAFKIDSLTEGIIKKSYGYLGRPSDSAKELSNAIKREEFGEISYRTLPTGIGEKELDRIAVGWNSGTEGGKLQRAEMEYYEKAKQILAKAGLIRLERRD